MHLILLVVFVCIYGDNRFSQTFRKFKNRVVVNRKDSKHETVTKTSSPDERFRVDDIRTAVKHGSFQSSVGKIRFEKLLGSGAFGKVYAGSLQRLDGYRMSVAIKFQKPLPGPFHPAVPMPEHYAEIEHEFKVMTRMKSYDGFPQPFAPNFSGFWKYYVMEHLGIDIDTIRLRDQKGRLPALLGIHVARQMLERIRAVHAEGFVVYDIHAGNFVLDEARNKVHMIDLAMAYPWRNADGSHITLSKAPFHFDNMRMRPVATRREEKGYISSRIDDIERLLYTLIIILKGSLPWQEIADAREARNLKLTMSSEDLCASRRLPWLEPVFRFVWALPFDSKPPYEYIDHVLGEVEKHVRESQGRKK